MLILGGKKKMLYTQWHIKRSKPIVDSFNWSFIGRKWWSIEDDEEGEEKEKEEKEVKKNKILKLKTAERGQNQSIETWNR